MTPPNLVWVVPGEESNEVLPSMGKWGWEKVSPPKGHEEKAKPPENPPPEVFAYSGPWASQHIWNRGSSHLKILHRWYLTSWGTWEPQGTGRLVSIEATKRVAET